MAGERGKGERRGYGTDGMDLPPRFWLKVDKEGPLWQGSRCWQWTATTNSYGYGRIWWRERTVCAHRLAYSALVGPIPDDLDIDHLCRNPACVNPAHMDVVTRSINTQRGLVAKHVGQPCAICGTHDGHRHGRTVGPARISGTRFGIAGALCYRCYNRLYERQRLSAARGENNG